MSLPGRRHLCALITLAAPRLALANAELRLAAFLPLSGPQAVLGDETWRGLELAAEERNGHSRIRLIRVDAQEPGAAVAELRRLAGTDRPAAVLGGVSSSMALAVSQAAEGLGIAFLELSATADAITDRGLRQVWRLGARAADFGTAIADGLRGVIAASLGTPADAMRVAILSDGGASAESLAAAAEASLAASGIGVALRFTAPAAEMPGAVQRMRAAGADIALHAGLEGDVAALFRAFRDGGWRPRAVMGLSGGHAVADTARAAAEGHDGTWVLDAPPVPAGHPLTEAYRRRYGSAPRSGHSLASYSLLMAVADALRPDPRAGLAALDLPLGALPNGWGLNFDARQQNMRAAPVLARWDGGALTLP